MFMPKKMPWVQSSSQLNRIMNKRGSYRRNSRLSNKAPRPKGKIQNKAFVDPSSLPHTQSPTRFGKFLVRVFDGNMHETQIQRLAHIKPKKRGSMLSRISRQSHQSHQSWKSRNSFLNVESSGEYSHHSTPKSSYYEKSSLASFSIKSIQKPPNLLQNERNQPKCKSISLSKSLLRRLDTQQTVKSEVIKGSGRIPNTIKENSITSASTAPSYKRIGLSQSLTYNRSKFKSSSFRPPSQRPLPTQSSFKNQADLNFDIKSVKAIQLFACKDFASRREKPVLKHPTSKFRTLSQKLREVQPAPYGFAQRRLNYPNPFIRELTRRQKELENFSNSTTRAVSLGPSLNNEPSHLLLMKSLDFTQSNPLSLINPNQSCQADNDYSKSERLSESFGNDLLDRFTRPSLNQLFTRIANKSTIRLEAQSKLSLCLSKFGL